MPHGWTWTQAYTDLFHEGVGVVSSSLVCLPQVDAGGYGPKVESWAFALIPETLHLLTSVGVFDVRTCKLCDDGVVVKGEYGIATNLMQHGWNLNTLMSMYRDVRVGGWGMRLKGGFVGFVVCGDVGVLLVLLMHGACA